MKRIIKYLLDNSIGAFKVFPYSFAILVVAMMIHKTKVNEKLFILMICSCLILTFAFFIICLIGSSIEIIKMIQKDKKMCEKHHLKYKFDANHTIDKLCNPIYR